MALVHRHPGKVAAREIVNRGTEANSPGWRGEGRGKRRDPLEPFPPRVSTSPPGRVPGLRKNGEKSGNVGAEELGSWRGNGTDGTQMTL